jgi:hypothetical protein
MPIAFTVFFGCLGLALCGIALKQIWLHYRIVIVGIEVEAQVAHFKKESSGRRRGASSWPTYHPMLSYTHAGESYLVKELDWGGGPTVFPGEQLIVKIDPARPDHALRKNGRSSPSGGFFAGFLGVLTLLLVSRWGSFDITQGNTATNVFVYGGALLLSIALYQAGWVASKTRGHPRVSAVSGDMEFPVYGRWAGEETTVGPASLRVLHYQVENRTVTALAPEMEKFVPGTHRYVYVNPKQPRSYLIDSPGDLWTISAILGFMGTVALLMGLLFRRMMG